MDHKIIYQQRGQQQLKLNRALNHFTGMLEESINIMYPSDLSLAPKLIGNCQFKKVGFKTSESV